MNAQSLTNELTSALEAAVVDMNSWFPTARELEQMSWVRATLPVVMQTITFSDAAHTFGVNWAAAAGATRVEIDATNTAGSAADPAPNLVKIGPSGIRMSLDNLQLNNSSPHQLISNAKPTRFVSLRLQNLRREDDADKELKSDSDLSGGLRLVLSQKIPNGEWVPVYTVPAIPADGVMPAMFSGASFRDRVVRFPAIQASEIRLSLVTGSRPESFQMKTALLDGVSGTEEVLPADLELTAPSGQVQWAFPGEMPAGTASNYVDLRNAVSLALNEDLTSALEEQRALNVQFALKGKSGTSAAFSFGQPRGSLLREHRGMQRFELRGEETMLDFGDALDASAPQEVFADLAVKYLGMKVLAVHSDFPLEPAEQVAGQVVGTSDVLRILEEGALAGRDVAQLALVGRAPVDCEVDVQLFKYQAGVLGDPLGMPARLELTASEDIGTHWLDIAELEDWEGVVAVRAHALSGRFLWAAREQPLLRIVVRDPDPGGAMLYLRNRGITANQFGMAIEDVQRDWRTQNFTSQVFRSAMPQLYSDLFLTVDFTDLTLRYRR